MIKRGLRLLLEKRDFALLMGAQFCAQAGDGIVQAALGKLIAFGGQEGFDIEGARSPDEILTIALFIFVPYTVFSPFLGVVIDRWERRRLLVVANGLRALAVAAVGLAGPANLPDAAVFSIFLLTLSSTRVVLATKGAALPVTLEGKDLVPANAVSQLGGAFFQLGGAGAAIVAAEFMNVQPIVLVGAVVYALGALSSMAIKRAGERHEPSTLAREIARVASNIWAGVREVARTPRAGAAVTTYFWLRVLWSFTLVGIGLIARELMGNKDLEIAVVIGGAGAAGAALGFMSSTRLLEKAGSTARLVLGSATVGGVAVTALGAIEARIALAALTFGLGFGFFLAKISLDTMVQESLGDDFRGRAFSLYDIAYNVAWVLAAGVLKAFWSDDLQGPLIAGMGATFLLGLFALALWYRAAGLLARAPATTG